MPRKKRRRDEVRYPIINEAVVEGWLRSNRDVVVLDQLSGQISRSGPAYARGAARQNAAIRQVDFHELNGEAYLMVEGLIELDKKRLAH